MRANRVLIWCSIGLLILSGIISLILEFQLDKKVIKEVYSFFSGHRSYVINVFLGVFTSSFVVFFTSMPLYWVSRKEALNKYWLSVGKLNQLTNISMTQMLSKINDTSDIILTSASDIIFTSIKGNKDILDKSFSIEEAYLQVVACKSGIRFLFPKLKPEIPKLVEETNYICGNINLIFTAINAVHLDNADEYQQKLVIDVFSAESRFNNNLDEKLNKLRDKLGIKTSNK